MLADCAGLWDPVLQSSEYATATFVIMATTDLSVSWCFLVRMLAIKATVGTFCLALLVHSAQRVLAAQKNSTPAENMNPLYAGHQRWVWDCVFSVDAAYLVTASSDCSARLWDLSTGEAIRMYSGHHKAATCCALNDSAFEGRED